MLDVLSRNMLKEAERIIRHFKELEAMFPPIADSEEEGSTAEAMRDILPDVYVSPRLEKSSLAGPSPKSRKDLTREVRAMLLISHDRSRCRCSIPLQARHM